MARLEVFINGRFLAQKLTGVQRYALETLLALDALLLREVRSDLSVTLLAPHGVKPPALHAIRFENVGPSSGHAWEQLVLPVAARRGWLLSFCATGPVAVRNQTVTIHDAAVYAMPQAFSRKFRLWYKLLLPALVRRTPLVMTVSRFSRGELVRYVGAEESRVRVSGEGWQHVRRVTADATVLRRHGLRSGRYVLAVSSVTPQKNFQLMAEAMPELASAGFDIAVAGRVEPRIFGNFDPGSLSSLKLLGYVSDAELCALYEHAGVFVYPSLYEGFGIPPLEAMAHGCPVLASNAASIPEVCGDAALYFSPSDAAGLAGLVRRVMSDPTERRALIERGRQRLLAHSWEASARSHLALLDEVMALSPGSAREFKLAAPAKT